MVTIDHLWGGVQERVKFYSYSRLKAETNCRVPIVNCRYHFIILILQALNM